MHFLHQNLTPITFRTRIYRPDLNYVSATLEKQTQKREFDVTPFHLDSPPESQTPLFLNPMDPPRFFRIWALTKGEELHHREPSVDHRGLIADPEYWKCEAEFFEQKYSNESNDISPLQYWQSKAAIWASLFEARRLGSSLVAREEINEKTYWEQENSHYNDLLDKVPSNHGLFTWAETSISHISLLPDTARTSIASIASDVTDSPVVIVQKSEHIGTKTPRRSTRFARQQNHKLHSVSNRVTKKSLSGGIRKAKQTAMCGRRPSRASGRRIGTQLAG